jgi:hypothetical protein
MHCSILYYRFLLFLISSPLISLPLSLILNHFYCCFSFISLAHIISIPLSPSLLLSVSISLFLLLSLCIFLSLLIPAHLHHSLCLFSLPTSLFPSLPLFLPPKLPPSQFLPTHPHLIQVPSYSMYVRYSGCHRKPIRPPGNASSLQPLM